MCSRASSSDNSSEEYHPRHRYYTRSSAREYSVSSNSDTSNIQLTSLGIKDCPLVRTRMDCPPTSLGEKVCRNRKMLLLITSVVSLALLSYFIHYRFTQYQKSIRGVKSSLCEIQSQMEVMKKNWGKGLKGNLVTMEEETKVKLDTIENLLEEIKKSQKEGGGGGRTTASGTSACLPEIEGGIKLDQPPLNQLIQQHLDVYHADKTGKTDFALEASGGRVVEMFNTELHNPKSKSLFGIPLCYESTGPTAILQPSVLPGECWAFKGSSGSVIIELLGAVFISSVSLEHIAKEISPSGGINSAPKEFSVWGLKDEYEKEGTLLGKFEYLIDGHTLQDFAIYDSSKSYRFIQFTVHSNHGNPDYTCVYRLRVHGTLDP